MRKLFVIGIGAGHPDHVTVQAVNAMNAVDAFFFADKGEAKRDLVLARREICRRHIRVENYRVVEIADPVRDPEIASYEARVQQWHEQRVLLYEQAICTELRDGEKGAFLVWGDPMLYDSTLRILDRILSRGQVSFEYEVIPGITSIQALTAAHRIPLNGIGESVLITTGRRLEESQFEHAEGIAVLLDAECSFSRLSPARAEIFWGAYIGTEQEILLSGALDEVGTEIQEARADARTRHGWMMDCYLLRRAQPATQVQVRRSESSNVIRQPEEGRR